jgi:phosphoribosylaminoimidazole-succinocarboxamide synthase
MFQKKSNYIRGTEILAEGKTKILLDVVGEPNLTDVVSKDDITAGDGKKHDVILGKGAVSNQTACNIFRVLAAHTIPTAFKEQSGPNSFIAEKCEMFPYEVVVRRRAYGSYLQRFPEVPKGFEFPELITEFFLKTKDRQWKGKVLVCDDPLMIHDAPTGTISLYDAHKPMKDQPEPFLVLDETEVFIVENESKYFTKMAAIARESFRILGEFFAALEYDYVDFKVEFGITASGRVVLADLIDSDSGRLLDAEGNHVDKQYYREGGDLDKLMKKFRLVADLTSKFQ